MGLTLIPQIDSFSKHRYLWTHYLNVGQCKVQCYVFFNQKHLLAFHLLFERNCKPKIVKLILSKDISHGLHYDLMMSWILYNYRSLFSCFFSLHFSYFFLQKTAFLQLVKSWLALGSSGCSSHRLSPCQNAILLSYTNHKEEE